MSAKTRHSKAKVRDWLARLMSLSANATELIQSGSRDSLEVEEVLRALQLFKENRLRRVLSPGEDRITYYLPTLEELQRIEMRVSHGRGTSHKHPDHESAQFILSLLKPTKAGKLIIVRDGSLFERPCFHICCTDDELEKQGLGRDVFIVQDGDWGLPHFLFGEQVNSPAERLYKLLLSLGADGR